MTIPSSDYSSTSQKASPPAKPTQPTNTHLQTSKKSPKRSPLDGQIEVTDDYHFRGKHPITGKPQFHYGYDIRPKGAKNKGRRSPIYASEKGTVIFRGTSGKTVGRGGKRGSGYGNLLVIEITDPNSKFKGHGLLYAHLDVQGELVWPGKNRHSFL